MDKHDLTGLRFELIGFGEYEVFVGSGSVTISDTTINGVTVPAETVQGVIEHLKKVTARFDKKLDAYLERLVRSLDEELI